MWYQKRYKNPISSIKPLSSPFFLSLSLHLVIRKLVTIVAQWGQRRQERGIGDTNRKIVRDKRLSREKSRDARNLKLSEIVIWLYRIERIVGIRWMLAREGREEHSWKKILEAVSFAGKVGEGRDCMHVHVQR